MYLIKKRQKVIIAVIRTRPENYKNTRLICLHCQKKKKKYENADSLTEKKKKSIYITDNSLSCNVCVTPKFKKNHPKVNVFIGLSKYPHKFL